MCGSCATETICHFQSPRSPFSPMLCQLHFWTNDSHGITLHVANVNTSAEEPTLGNENQGLWAACVTTYAPGKWTEIFGAQKRITKDALDENFGNWGVCICLMSTRISSCMGLSVMINVGKPHWGIFRTRTCMCESLSLITTIAAALQCCFEITVMSFPRLPNCKDINRQPAGGCAACTWQHKHYCDKRTGPSHETDSILTATISQLRIVRIICLIVLYSVSHKRRISLSCVLQQLNPQSRWNYWGNLYLNLALIPRFRHCNET